MSEEIETDSRLFNSGLESDRVNLPTIHLLPAEGNITYEILDALEADLDFSEKISLVFLLYGNVDLALQHLKKESRITQGSGSEYLPHSGLLSGWARSERQWEERFLEALCIIQNFYVVERLGYNRDDTMQKFLPENPYTSMNVNNTRKALYIFCEKLSTDQESCLINRIEDKLGRQKTPSFIRGNLKCMETFFLYMMSQKIILYHNGLKIVTRHLKAMEEIGLYDFLEPLSSRHEVLNHSIRRSSSSDDESIVGTNRAPSIVSTTNAFESTTTNSDDIYKIIDHTNIGICVIINQKRFYSDSDILLERLLENRIGTDEDRDRLQEAFGNYGFTVQIWEDLTHVQLIEAVDFATKNLVKEDHSYFVLCILSHGQRGIVYGVDSVAVKIDEIHSKIQGRACPQLINKPKILIIQACQGDECQEALPSFQPDDDLASDGPRGTRMTRVPEISDSLIITSTIPGYVSYRDRLTGSWFIQSLCTHLLSATEDIDIRDVFLKVSNEVQKFEAPEGKAMQPESKSTLKLKPYLPYYRPSRKMVAKLMIKRIVFFELLKEYLSTEKKVLRAHKSVHQ